MRHLSMAALIVSLLFALSTPADAAGTRCDEAFPEVDWVVVAVDAPVSVATTGMSIEMANRYAADAERVANLLDSEIGGLEGTVLCLTVPDVRLDLGDLIAEGQRLHVGVFGQEKLFVLSAVEIRMVDDAIAYGLPFIALWNLGTELGLDQGYPDPLATTIAHWYLARDNDRLERYHAQLVVQLFLDDPNPADRTVAESTPWTAGSQQDPYFFDPQFVASPMGTFIDYAVATRGVEVLRDPSQETWAPLEIEWRVALRDELLAGREGSWGAEWGAALIIGFVLLAILLAWLRRRQKRRAAQRRPTPPADESLFVSQIDEGG